MLMLLVSHSTRLSQFLFFPILLYRTCCLLMLLRGTKCLCTCCRGRWTPVSTRPSLRAVENKVLPMSDGQRACCLILVLLVVMPGPVVGEFPAQNDVNLAPAPSLPQVMHAPHVHVCASPIFSPRTDLSFCVFSPWWSRT